MIGSVKADIRKAISRERAAWKIAREENLSYGGDTDKIIVVKVITVYRCIFFNRNIEMSYFMSNTCVLH